MSLSLVLLGLVLFVSLVVIHELGHFFAARRSGVEVEEFGIGFPPKVWGKKLKSGVLFTINLLPLGGFVKLKGEHDADRGEGSYGAASLKNKTKIIAAGILMNLVVAIGLFTLLGWVGMPKLLDNQFTVARDTKIIRSDVLVAGIEADSPAAQAGLQAKDQLTGIGPHSGAVVPITSSKQLPEITQQYAGQNVLVTYERSGQEKQEYAKLRTTEEVEVSKKIGTPKGYLGVAPQDFILQRSTWSAPIMALGVTKQLTELTLKGLGSAIANVVRGEGQKASEQVAGPVGIFVVIRDGSILGFQFIVTIIALLSLTLAIMNALPIPALDGGRLFVTYLFRLLKKPLTPKTEDLIHSAGFMVLILLCVLITVVDIRRFF